MTLYVQQVKRKMMDAAIRGKAEIIKALAKMKADINCKDKVNAFNTIIDKIEAVGGGA